jgi:hypothetical protein
MQFDLRQFPDPSPPPVKEPPDSPEQPDVPVREPDPAEPSLAERWRKQVPVRLPPSLWHKRDERTVGSL